MTIRQPICPERNEISRTGLSDGDSLSLLIGKDLSKCQVSLETHYGYYDSHEVNLIIIEYDESYESYNARLKVYWAEQRLYEAELKKQEAAQKAKDLKVKKEENLRQIQDLLTQYEKADEKTKEEIAKRLAKQT